MQRKLLQLFAALLIVSAASIAQAQRQEQAAPKASKIAAIAIAGTRKFTSGLNQNESSLQEASVQPGLIAVP